MSERVQHTSPLKVVHRTWHFPPIDTPLIYYYKHHMDRIRTILALTLALALTACNGGAGVPIPFVDTVTPSATATPEFTPTPTSTATPEPLPTPSPLTRVQSGEKALFYGDYDTARREYETAYRDGDSPQVRAAALWGLARTAVAERRYSTALVSLQQILTEFPDSAFVPYANFMIGQVQYELEHFREAEQAYDLYMQARPGVLDAYVQEIRGDALSAQSLYPEALEAYQKALEAQQIGDPLSLQIKLAQTRADIGDYAGAISAYETIFTNTDNDYIKAQMDYLGGLAHQQVAQSELANEKFLHAVENYPLSYYSYLSLVELVAAGSPVSDLDRGLVDYFAEQYDVALAAFDRYMQAGLDEDGTARYYRALTERQLQNYQNAVDGLSSFISDFPAHPKWVAAWEEKAYTQWFYMDNDQGAAQTYLDFVNAAPAQPEAADFLMSAARTLEREDRLEEAAATWQRVADEYPDNLQSSQALFLAGIVQYRLGSYDQALPTFQRSLLLATEKEEQARAYLWVGKTQEKLGDQTAMQAAWQQAQSIDPTGYYSERARELLIGRAPFSPPAVYDINIDLEAERKDADAWMRIQFGMPPGTDLNGLGSLAGDPRIVRGTEFWELGLYDQARLEFEDLREAVSGSPEGSYRLANYLLDLGLYRSAIFAARQVLTLAGLDEHSTSLNAPKYFNHVRYGTYYADLIVPEAEAQGFHPLFMFSVMRQESLFEGFVHSTAGARGLMQIIPSTGSSIANQLGWPTPYDEEDLYRPNVSVRLGTYYMASNRNLLGGDLYAMLAAYNGGPGNALAWKELGGDDPDLQLEVIRFQETRNYIRFIYEIYTIYRSLYSPVS